MNIQFVEQHLDFVFNVNDEYFRTSFERNEKAADWSVRLVDISQNKTVYSKILDAVVVPDHELAEEIVRTYLLTTG